MSETISFEFLGCEWTVGVYIEEDDETTPGSVEVESIEGYAAGTLLPGELVNHLYKDVSERAREAVARG